MTDDVLLLFMMLGGLAMVATAFLPGQNMGWRVFCGVLGTVVFVWMGWVYLFGGTYFVNAFFVLLPFILVAQSVRTMLRTRREAAAYQGDPAHQYGYGQPVYPPYDPAHQQGQYPQAGHVDGHSYAAEQYPDQRAAYSQPGYADGYGQAGYAPYDPAHQPRNYGYGQPQGQYPAPEHQSDYGQEWPHQR